MTAPARPVALVTGAAKRIGCVLARDLAAAGYAVAVHHNSSADDARAVVEAIRGAGGVAEPFEADLADAAAVAALVPAVTAVLGAPVLLVNNASLFLYDDVATLDDEQWEQHADINLKAAVFLARAVAAGLPERASANVVNIIDQRVWKPTPLYFSYAVSKAGLWAATRMLAQALAPNVRVNAIGPGPVLRSIHQSDAEFAAQCRSTLLERGSTPEEIASAIGFILAAPSMTGQMIALDGGQHLAWRTPDVTGEGGSRSKTPLGLTPFTTPFTTPARRTVTIDRLQIETIIGIHPFEQQTPQRIFISVVLTVAETGTPGSDRFDEVVDYQRIVEDVRAVVRAGTVNLIETMAERVSAVCLVDPRVLKARITIEKPDIFPDCASVGVTIERSARAL